MKSLAGEVWKSIGIHEGYEASNYGRIKSLDRLVIRTDRWGHQTSFRWNGRIRKLTLHHTGYLICNIATGKRMYRVHQLVAMAFHGPCPDAMVVNHINGNKTDNRPENLEYVSNRDNVLHSYRTGLLTNLGERNGKATITVEMAADIKRTACKEKNRETANRLGCSINVVRQIRWGKTWKEVVA